MVVQIFIDVTKLEELIEEVMEGFKRDKFPGFMKIDMLVEEGKKNYEILFGHEIK